MEDINLEELFPPIVPMVDQSRIWLEKEPSRLIFTWDDLVLKFINQFFPPSKTTNLRNEITNFQQCFDESFSEAWDGFNDLLRACPHYGFSELHQLDTFYNALNLKDQDSLNFAASGNFLDKMPRECLAIIESKSKVRYSRNKPIVAKVNTNTSTFGISPNVAELKDMVKALLLDEESQSPAPVKAVEESYVVENEPEATKDTMNPTNNESTEDVQPQVVQSKFPILTSKPVTSLISEPVIAPVSASKPNPKTSIPYPSRRNDERNHEKANNQIEKFYQIFKDMSFEISFAYALILMPKFASTLKALIGNKEKLSEMARTPLNEHYSAVLLNKLPKKLRDPGDFLIPCDFLELTDRSISRPVGVAEDVYVKVGSFHFPADFVVVDFDADPRAITFNLYQTSRYSANYNDMTAKRIDVTDMACEEYSQEVLGFSDTISSGNPTPYYDPIVSKTSLTLTPFRNSYFLLEEVDAFLAIEDDPNLPEFYQPYLDPEGDILLLEAFLNDDPLLPRPNQRNYFPEVRKELKIYEAKSDKSLVDEPPAVELKYLPTHLKYAFLEGNDKLPIIIAKDSSVEEKAALITVLKSHKRAIAWKLSDIKGIDPEFCTHKNLMEEDIEPAVQHQRRVNPKIHDVIKQEVIKLLEARLIYPISDSPWVSPVHCVPKKGGFTVVENEDNELILTRLVMGWRVCIDYRKLNEATRKDHFPLPFMDQMLERLAGNQYYCFLDGFFGYLPWCKFRFSLAAKITEILVVTVSLCRVLRLGFSLVGRSLLSEIPRVESTNFKFDRDEPVDKGDILIKEHVLDFLLTMNHSKEADNPVPRSLSYLIVHIIDTHVDHLEDVVSKLDIQKATREFPFDKSKSLLNMIQRQQEIKNMFINHNATLSTVSFLPDLDLGIASLGISLRRDGPTGEKANLGTQPNETCNMDFDNGNGGPVDALQHPPLVPEDVVPIKAELVPAKKKVMRVPMARRDLGTKGQKAQLLINHFKVNVSNVEGHFFHYSVALFYEDGHPIDGKGVGRKVLDKVHETYGSELAGKKFAYDGEKSLFTLGALPRSKLDVENKESLIPTLEFTVVLENATLNRNNGSASPENDADKKRLRGAYQSKTFKVELSYAAIAQIPMQVIAQALRGQESKSSQEALRVLDIILRQHAVRQGCLLVRHSFFCNDPKNFADVGGGVLGCRGFHSSFCTSQAASR
nr:protein argonaute 4-like isoform X1 [Tanacetum cinerariifolium]